MQLRKEAWKKIQDFNEVWTRDHAITGVMIYQLSYEATDVGSRSIVGSYVPVKEMSVHDIYELRKWNENEEMIIAVNAIYEKKNSELQRGLNTSFMGTYEPTIDLLPMSGFIAQLVEHCTSNRKVTSSNPVEVLNFLFQAVLRNCINCVHCDDNFFIFTKISCTFGFISNK